MDLELSLAFRPATSQDVPILLEMQQSYYVHEGYPFVSDRAARALEELACEATLGRLFVAEVSDRIVGYLAVTFGFSLEFGGRDAFVDELYLVPEVRGRGLGTEALRVAELACREARLVALHLEVEFSNDRAKALYARSGFVEHSRHLMTKRLAAASAAVGSPRVVFVASGDTQAEQVRGFLEANGIPVELRGESLRKTHGLTLDGLGSVELMVADVDEARACDLLSSAERGDFRLPEGEVDSDRKWD